MSLSDGNSSGAPSTGGNPSPQQLPVASGAVGADNGTGETPTPPEGTEKEDPKFAARFAALSRKEKMLLDRDKRLKAEEAEYSAWKKTKENAKVDPIAFLEANGLNYNQVTEYLLSRVDNGEGKALSVDEKLAALEKRIEDEKREKLETAKAQEAKENEQAINGFKESIREHLEAGADTYELIRANEAEELVWQVVEDNFEATGKILPIPDALNAVESWLETQVREKILKLKKFAPKSEAPVAETEKVLVRPVAPPPTLTNRVTNAITPAANPPGKLISAEESKRRAAALLKWT